MYQVLAQGIGFCGLGVAIISFQQNTQKKIMLFQMMASVFFSVHFYMLGAYVGAAMNMVGIFRAFIFYHRDKSWASHPVWLAVFIVAYLMAGILSWQNIYSLLPTVAMVLTTISFRIKNPKYVRLITLPGSPCWFTYNLLNGSIPGMLTELFISTSIIVAMFRFDIRWGARKKVGSEES